MKRILSASLLLAITLGFPAPARPAEELPDSPELPGAARSMLQSYVQVSRKVLVEIDGLFKVKDADPRTLSKTLWEDTCQTASTALGLYMSNAAKLCANDGLKALPTAVLVWQTKETIHWASVEITGAKLFGNRNFMAQFCWDLAQVDGPAWFKKQEAIYEAGEEIDKEHGRLSGLMGALGTASKSQLQSDQKIALQMKQMTKAVAGKCRDLKKDMEGWYISRTKPDQLKQWIGESLTALGFDKDASPEFFKHQEVWRGHLEAWLKQYTMFHTDFGKMIEEFGKETNVFKGHGKILEGRTFDQIENDLGNEFADFYNRITIALAGR
ncbi:MAG: hypothetical protein MUE73_08675 [Planctomycetes bacterium]|nr:hypothetical protein [Planctomycetota bacterium]